MVAEAGEIQVESFPKAITGKPPSKCAEKLTAKKAVVLARKSSRRNKSQTKPNLTNSDNDTDIDSDKKEKKRKKFQPAPWLCENMGVQSAAPIRSFLDDAIAFMEGKEQPSEGCYNRYDESGFNFDEYERVMFHPVRLKRKTCLMHRVKTNPKIKNYATKCKLQDKVIVQGKKVVINNGVMSRLSAQDEEITIIKERRNDRTSRKLDRLGIPRYSEWVPKESQTAENASTAKTKPNYTRAKRPRRGIQVAFRKPRWTPEQKEQRVYIPHEFELVTAQVDHDDPDEANLLCFLLDLQHREMTPEDYDMLLQLDDKIAPKTIEGAKLASLRTVTVVDVATDGPGKGIPWEDSQCAVCMEPYEQNQTVKFLPCEHFFHSNCIEMWLNNSGNTCPLDGLEL
ncbi:uncharacterized protein LOC129277298 [Lytechinus pictus]|uniref:uncharacterized protein LOC129277298 n=1 Tax=Lytechinus pictus TaxID=7653 RepID=UPI0030B9E024